MQHPPQASLWLSRQIPSCKDLSTSDLAQYFSLSEQARLAAISAPRRKLEYISGHLLIRQALNSVFPGWHSDNHIEHLESQAPEIKGPNLQKINFNLSHSNNIVGCAVCSDSFIGLDIETNYRVRPYSDIAQQYFSKREAEQIAKLPRAEQQHTFYRLWTLKESLLKAQRKQIDQASMAVEFSKKQTDNNTPFHSCNFMLDENTYLSLCLSKKLTETIKIYEYHFNDEIISSLFPYPALTSYVPLL